MKGFVKLSLNIINECRGLVFKKGELIIVDKMEKMYFQDQTI